MTFILLPAMPGPGPHTWRQTSKLLQAKMLRLNSNRKPEMLRPFVVVVVVEVVHCCDWKEVETAPCPEQEQEAKTPAQAWNAIFCCCCCARIQRRRLLLISFNGSC